MGYLELISSGSQRFNVSRVRQDSLAWLSGLGWQVAHGPDIALGTQDAERTDCGQVVLEQQLRDTFTALNSVAPIEALTDGFCRPTNPKG